MSKRTGRLDDSGEDIETAFAGGTKNPWMNLKKFAGKCRVKTANAAVDSKVVAFMANGD